jgi:iron complex outermembrane recepter protein
MGDVLNRRRRSVFAAGLYVLFCSLGATQLLAQTPGNSATISGTVLDPAGMAVPNAGVSVKNEVTGTVHSATTSDEGRFSVNGLPVGSYTIEVAAPGFASARSTGLQLGANGLENISIALTVASISQEVIVSEFFPLAATLAPSQSSLDARSAQSVISPDYIRNFTSPIADYTEVVQMAPGTFSFAPNGAGLGDSKTFFRGFQDGDYTMTFDGIPFNDTNTPTHHSWAFFPGQFIGQTVFDRSPGSASTIGPTNFGGSINMMSPHLRPEQNVRGTVSYGSFNTRLYEASFDSGRFGPGGKSNFTLDLHQMKSDGYQTFNFQRRNAFLGKYQYTPTSKVTLTLFTSIVELKSNTPDTKVPTRANVAKFGDDYLMTDDPTKPNYYKYNFYHIPSDFDYVGLTADLGHGWLIDNKVYTYRYYNKQNFNDPTKLTATSGVDKLNSYRKYGELIPVTQVSKFGILRTGLWYEYAKTNRFQTPSDPRTWVDQALPNFHEKFNTTSAQPYVEYQWFATRKWSITPGIKFVYYKFDLTQFADNGKTVGNLNGAPFVQHEASFRTWQPSFDMNYKLRHNWSVYGQFAIGSEVPPSKIFDVKDAEVAVLPKPTKTRTYQVGSVWKSGRVTLDFDSYITRFENGYSSFPDPNNNNEPVYYLSGTSKTKGVEAEGTIFLGAGLSAYLNGTLNSAKYNSSGLWLANAPRNTATVGLSYQRQNWDLGFFNKHIGSMWNDNGTINQAVRIDPFEITNLYLNYTIKNHGSEFSQTKVRLTINNLFDKHSIVAVKPASTASNLPAPDDQITMLAARSISLSLTFGFAPKR